MSERIFGLDLFRSIAIILVVLTHGVAILELAGLEKFPFIKMIDGVDLFFVLSGYLIGGILIKQATAAEQFKVKDLIHFWKRRWFRTLPNYYLVLGLNFIVVYYGIINENIENFNWKFLLFLQNFSSPFTGFFWESWSLSVEEWFYIFIPIIFLILLKIYNVKKAFLFSSLILFIFSLSYRLYHLDPTIDNFWYDVRFRKIVLGRFDSLSVGLLAIWVKFYYLELWDKFRIHLFILGIILITFLVNYPSNSNTFYKQIINLSLTPVAAACLLPFAANLKTNSARIRSFFTEISKISYSMYLVNLALGAEIIMHNFPPKNSVESILLYLLYWAWVIVVSKIIYKYYELPIMKLRDR
ncbi:MAG: acyltransferase [Bacteroidetes bacterium]|nr:acyltransferase [Bacteroidota bacterium]